MKLSPITFIIMGLCVCLVCLTFGYVTMAPNNQERAAREANTQAANDEAAKQSSADKRVKNAVKLVEAEGAKWRDIAATRTPGTDVRAGGIDISENGSKLVVDSRQFRDSIQTAVNKQVRVGGVKLVNDGPQVTDPSQSPSTILADYYNYPAIPFPVVIFDLGTITVEGTYSQICENVRAWAHMPNYLAVADGLRIEGTSPHMTGTYAVSIVGYVHGTKLFSKLPETPGSSAAGGIGGSGVAGVPGGAGGRGAPMGGGKSAFMSNLSGGGGAAAKAGK